MRSGQPFTQDIDAARQGELSDAELAQSGNNIRLDADHLALLQGLSDLGEVVAITANETVVHEITGYFDEMGLHKKVAQFFPPGINTQYFLQHWGPVFAVDDDLRLGLKFFDRFGAVAHEVRLGENANHAAYQRLIEIFRDLDQDASLRLETPTQKPLSTIRPKLDENKLRLRWSTMRDVYEASRLIDTLGCGDHLAVYRLLGEQYANPLQPALVARLLENLAMTEFKLQITVASDTAVQTFSGRIRNNLHTNIWYNIIDPEFRLHLRPTSIAEVWLLRKPTNFGWITALEVFDHSNRHVLSLCDNRAPDRPESAHWTETLLDTAGSYHL